MAQAKGKKTPIPGQMVSRASGMAITYSAQQMPYASGSWSYFGPGMPLAPVAPQAEGRQFDYPMGYNLDTRPRGTDGSGITFEMLRALAENYDLLRLVIETRKDQVESYEWEIVAKEENKGKIPDSALAEVRKFFLRPDREHMWTQWLRMFLEDMFVIDAVCLYPRPTKGGQVWSFDLIDGASIKRLIDDTGRTPAPPDPAYQQVLKGMPAVDYTTEQLVYFMRNPRTFKVYGYSPVEQVIMTVNIAMRRQVTQLEHFTDGNVPDALASVPETWGPKDIKQFQIWWDEVLQADTGRRHKMKFVPTDASKIMFTRQPDLKDLFDEWLARIVCFAFSISPTMLVKETNRATAETVQEEAKREGLTPLLTYIKRCMDFMIETYLQVDGVEFKWKTTKDVKPVDQATIDEKYVAMKVITPDEVRKDRYGKDPLSDEEKERAWPQPPAPNPFGVPGEGVDGSKPPLQAGAKPEPGSKVTAEEDEEGVPA